MRTYAVSPTRSRRRQDAPPGHFWPGAGDLRVVGLPAQQLRQLGNVRRPSALYCPVSLIPSQSVWGGPSSSFSLAVSIAMRLSASARVRFGLNASSS